MQEAAERLLGRPDAPSAIVTNSDYAAHGVYKAAREMGLEVGPQVSVVGHDDLPTSELLDPPLSTLRVDRREMGRELMVRLIDTRSARTTWRRWSTWSGSPFKCRSPSVRVAVCGRSEAVLGHHGSTR